MTLAFLAPYFWNRAQQLFTAFPWLEPLSFLAAGILVGLIAEGVILLGLRRLAARTPWHGDDVVVDALRGMPFLWSVLAGLYLASVRMEELAPRWQHLTREALLVLFLLSLTWTVARAAAGLVSLYATRTPGLFPSTSIFRNLTTLLVLLLGGLVILQTLGISITPALTALGVGGLAVALALQDTLANLFSGIQILASRQVHIGDYIKLATGEEGYVTDIRWRNTTIRALPNNMIIVPNSKLAAAVLTNYYQPGRDLAVLVQVGVSYGSDLEQVERVTIEVGKEVMREVQGGVPDFEPFVRYNQFADSSINFTVILRGGEFVDQYLVTHEFIKRLHRRYQREGIEIPFPQRTVHLPPARQDG